MGALFKIFVAVVAALATAAFAHFGMAVDSTVERGGAASEERRAVKRSPVLTASGPALAVAVRR